MGSIQSFSVFLIIVLLIFMASVNDVQAQYGKWHRDTCFHGIEFKKVRFRMDGKESLFAEGVLKHKTIIQGYPCYREITLDKKGRPKRFILHKRAAVSGNSFEKDTRVVLQSDRDYSIWCLNNAVVQGYACKGSPYRRKLFLGLPSSNKFELYPGGRLKRFQPVDPVQIQGVWCRSSGGRGPVRLYESGQLQGCTSAREQIIEGVAIRKNSRLNFAKDGTLIYDEKEKIYQ